MWFGGEEGNGSTMIVRVDDEWLSTIGSLLRSWSEERGLIICLLRKEEAKQYINITKNSLCTLEPTRNNVSCSQYSGAFPISYPAVE